MKAWPAVAIRVAGEFPEASRTGSTFLLNERGECLLTTLLESGGGRSGASGLL